MPRPAVPGHALCARFAQATGVFHELRRPLHRIDRPLSPHLVLFGFDVPSPRERLSWQKPQSNPSVGKGPHGGGEGQGTAAQGDPRARRGRRALRRRRWQRRRRVGRRIDEDAVRNTRDVDLLVRRADSPAARAALEAAGFVYHHLRDIDTFIDGPEGKPSGGMHILFAGEKVRRADEHALPNLEESERAIEFQVATLEALVRMKLTAWATRTALTSAT